MRNRPAELGCKRLVDVVDIEQASDAQDSHGAPAPVWSALLDDQPALVGTPSGQEIARFESMETIATHTVWMRRDLSVTQEMRVKVVSSRTESAGAILSITGIAKPDDAPDWMLLACKQNT